MKKNNKDSYEKILYNILSNFINSYNGDYLSEVFSRLEKKNVNKFEVDLLKKEVFPKASETSTLKKVIFYSHRLLMNDLDDFNIDIKNIKKAIVLFISEENIETSLEVLINAEIITKEDRYSKKIKIRLVKTKFFGKV